MYQEYKVVGKDDFECFFFAHSGWTALYYAKNYMAKYAIGDTTLYSVNEKPYGARWLEVRL